jgi:hypothetical protein
MEDDLAWIAAARKAVADIRPSSIVAYPDRVHLWLPQPLPVKDLEWLDTQCGEQMYVRTRPKRWQRSYQQHLQLPQPTPAALRFLSKCNGALMNYAEPAMDWIFNDCEQNEHAGATVRQYVVKRHHREQQGVHTVREATRYTAPRRSSSNLVVYADRTSRTTGELDCTHIELRLRRPALQRAGLHTIKDLVEMDSRAFWLARLILRAVDPDRFGRSYRVHVEGNRKRNGICEDDGEVGRRLIRVCGGTTQEVIDSYRNRFNVSRCLVDLDVSHLLPEGVENGVENSRMEVNGRMCRRDNGIVGVSDQLSPLIIEQRHTPTCTSSTRPEHEPTTNNKHIGDERALQVTDEATARNDPQRPTHLRARKHANLSRRGRRTIAAWQEV